MCPMNVEFIMWQHCKRVLLDLPLHIIHLSNILSLVFIIILLLFVLFFFYSCVQFTSIGACIQLKFHLYILFFGWSHRIHIDHVGWCIRSLWRVYDRGCDSTGLVIVTNISIKIEKINNMNLTVTSRSC